MKIPFHQELVTDTLVAVIAIISAAFFSGCGQATSAKTSPSAGSSPTSNSPPSEAAVVLSQSQLNAIKVEPAGTYLFPVEKEAVGSISFDEDPAIVQAESTLIAAAATLQLTSKELARVESLGQTNGVSQREMEQATSEHQTATAALKAARDALRALGKTDAEIDETVKAGKIESAPATNAPSRWVLANVAESDSPFFRVGQPVRIKVTAYPDRVFEGKISRIYATVDPATHRMAIRCEVQDPKNELRPGMLANIVIRVQDPVEAIAIPANGVVRESDGTMTAWVTTDRHRFTQKIIQTGLRNDGRVQILEGLQRGELAVTEGAVFLSNMLNAPPGD